MSPNETIQKIKNDISFWEREITRAEKDKIEPEHIAYYTGMVDGMKEVLSYFTVGKSLSTIEIETMVKAGLNHKRV